MQWLQRVPRTALVRGGAAVFPQRRWILGIPKEQFQFNPKRCCSIVLHSDTMPAFVAEIKRDLFRADHAFKKSATNTTRAGLATLLANF